jgi:hypothetical protein
VCVLLADFSWGNLAGSDFWHKTFRTQRSALMDRPPADDRSALSLAWAWASRIIAVAATLVVPALIGFWIGQKFGDVWTIVLLLVGFALGSLGAVFQLMQIAKESQSFRSDEPDRDNRKR